MDLDLISLVATFHPGLPELLVGLGAIVSSATVLATGIRKVVVPVLERLADATAFEDDREWVDAFSRGLDVVIGALTRTGDVCERASLVKRPTK